MKLSNRAPVSSLRGGRALSEYRLMVLFALLALCLTPALAQDADPAEAARAAARKVFEEHKVPGMALAVSKAGEIVFSAEFGSADLEADVAVGPRTKFRVGSISKLFTVAALAKLVEAGKIDLEASVRSYVPYFPEKEHEFSVRQLAAHTAGIRHYKMTDPLQCPRPYATVESGIEIFRDDPLLFEPGTAYSYTSYGYNLLSAALEGASGKDFAAYLKEAVLSPLGLEDSALDLNSAIIPHRTRFYSVNGETGEVTHAPCVDNSYKWASGGILSSARDLVRLCDAFIRPGYLRRETIERVFTAEPNAVQESFEVGLGWRISQDPQGRTFYHHGGAIAGGRAFVLIYPDSQVSVAIVANSYAGIGYSEAFGLAQGFLGER